jgi:hypothetical protein
VLEKILARGDVPAESVAELAKHGDEAVTELIATNEDRLLKHPSIIECLYMNRHTRMSTADRLIDLASRNGVHLSGIPAFREAAMALEGELIPEAGEPTPDDELFVETAALASALESPEEEDTHHEDPRGARGAQRQVRASLPAHRPDDALAEDQARHARHEGRAHAARARLEPRRGRGRGAQPADARRRGGDADQPQPQPERGRAPGHRHHARSGLKQLLGEEEPRREPQDADHDRRRGSMPHLREAELRHLAKNKNVTGPVKDAARRQLERRK